MSMAQWTIPVLSFPFDVGAAQGMLFFDDDVFHYGAAATAFLRGNLVCSDGKDPVLLRQELELHLNMFAEDLHPWVEPDAHPRPEGLLLSESVPAVSCDIRFGHWPIGVNAYLYAEHITFHSLRDFLLTDLHRAIQQGNGPRQCRLCGKWFLHVHGEKYMYCEGPAPGTTGKTCREAGPRASFEQKLRQDDVWSIYKRAYKKYYARVMKDTMTRDEFNLWAEQAASIRDMTIESLKGTTDAERRAAFIEQLRQKLNKL